MFRVKICGVTTPDDALMAVDAGADAIGINFFPGSPRFLSPDAAEAVAEVVRGKALLVGVFVNAGVGAINEAAHALGLDVVQLSGDETAEDAALVEFPKIRAIRGADPATLSSFAGYPCDLFLLDGAVPGEYGGTGRRLAWDGLSSLVASTFGATVPWILAGGLKTENVAEAIRRAGAFGVDTASGVESFPGRKDYEKTHAFVANARRAFGL